MRWLPGSLATPTRQPLGARPAANSPLTRGLVGLINNASTGGLARVGSPDQSRIALAGGIAHAGNNSSMWTQDTQPLGSAATLFWMGELSRNATSGAVVGVGNAGSGNQVFCLQGAAPGTQPRALIRTTNGGGITTAEIAGFTFDESIPGVRVFAVRYDGTSALRVFLDGQPATGGNANTGSSGAMSAMSGLSLGGANRNASPLFAQSGQNGLFAALYSRALSDAEISDISRNHWRLFEQPARPLWAPASTLTVYRPGSDVIVNGWTSTPSGSLASCIDDPTLDRADFITSPNLTDPATLTWASSLPAGSYSISVDADRLGASGQVRIVCLDSGGTSVGATSWQALTATATTYLLSVTTTGTSTQFRIEVQA